MQATVINEELEIGELNLKQLSLEFADLPLFQWTKEADGFVEFGYCKLRTLAQLKDLKEQYQKIYFSKVASIKGKRAVFLQLKKLNYRISKFELDTRRLG